MKPYDARLVTPFGVMGILTRRDAVVEVDFLPAGTAEREPATALAGLACAQIQAYLDDPAHPFDLPLCASGSPFQLRVWQALREIPCGSTRTYGALARQLGTSARAVGRACGANPIALIVPCHRVVASDGLGGFMGHREGTALSVKGWLLEHERGRHRPAG